MPRNGYKIFLRNIFLEKATRESRIYENSKISKSKKKKEKDIKSNLMEIKRLTQFSLSQSALLQTYQEKKLEISLKKKYFNINI